jgi:hypothetical protein
VVAEKHEGVKEGTDAETSSDRLSDRMGAWPQDRESKSARCAFGCRMVESDFSYNNDGVSIAATFLLPDRIDETLIPVATVFEIAFVRPSLRKRCMCSVGNRFMSLWTPTK